MAFQGELRQNRQTKLRVLTLACCMPMFWLAFHVHAASIVTLSDMAIAMHRYYDAEQNPLPYMMVACLLTLLLAAILAKRSNRFLKGIALALAIFSLLIGVGSLVYFYQIGPKHAMYAALLASDPAGFQAQEQLHLQTMLDGFVHIIATDIAITLTGLGMAIYGGIRQKRLIKGLGVGILVCALMLTGLEMHNRNRAENYLQTVQTFHPNVPAKNKP